MQGGGGLAAQQGGYVQSAPQAKTMMAQSPFAAGVPGGPGPGGYGAPGGMAPGGMPQPGAPAGANQKTMIAGMAPVMPPQTYPQVGGPPQGMPMGGPQGMPMGGPQGMPMGGPHGMQGGPGPNKTVMLQPSEGVVSVAHSGHAVQAVGTSGRPQVIEGASTLFWIVCLLTGIAVGVLGYVIVLQL